MIDPIQPEAWKPRSPPVNRPNTSPPSTDPTTPRTMVRRMPMSSLPGTTARAMKPTTSPNTIQPRIVKIIPSPLRSRPWAPPVHRRRHNSTLASAQMLDDLGERGHVRFQDADVAGAELLPVAQQPVGDLARRPGEHPGQLGELVVTEAAGLTNDLEVELVRAVPDRRDEQVQLDVVEAVAGGLAQHLNAAGERILRSDARRDSGHDGEAEDVGFTAAELDHPLART